MGWRDTQRQVASGEKSFRPKADPFGEFAEGFVKSFTAIKQEERLKEREDKIYNRRIAREDKLLSDRLAREDSLLADARSYETTKETLKDQKEKEKLQKTARQWLKTHNIPVTAANFELAYTQIEMSGVPTLETMFANGNIKFGGAIKPINESAPSAKKQQFTSIDEQTKSLLNTDQGEAQGIVYPVQGPDFTNAKTVSEMDSILSSWKANNVGKSLPEEFMKSFNSTRDGFAQKEKKDIETASIEKQRTQLNDIKTIDDADRMLRTELSLGENANQVTVARLEGIKESLLAGEKKWADAVKINTVFGKSSTEIEQQIAFALQLDAPESELVELREQLRTKVALEKSDEFKNYVSPATTLANATNQLAIAQEKGADQGVIDHLNGLIKQFNNKAVKKALSEKGELILYTRSSDGGFRDAIVVTKTVDGFVNTATNEVISPEALKTGKLTTKESGDQFIKTYNDNITKTGEAVTNGLNAVTTVLQYRQLVRTSPAGVNPYINFANAIQNQAASLSAAFNSMVIGGSYDYGFEGQFFSNLDKLSAENKNILQAQLRAAYAIAASRGSKGQGLSDKELQQNLNALGAGQTNPTKIMGLINGELKNVVMLTEQKRKGALSTFISREDVNVMLSDTIIAVPFTDTIANEISEGGTLVQYADDYNQAMDDDREVSVVKTDSIVGKDKTNEELIAEDLNFITEQKISPANLMWWIQTHSSAEWTPELINQYFPQN